jgi:hypothetical protein
MLAPENPLTAGLRHCDGRQSEKRLGLEFPGGSLGVGGARQIR